MKLVDNNVLTATWRPDGSGLEIECLDSVLEEITQKATEGHHRYIWGGVEIGGVLFGRKEENSVRIMAICPAQCEHHYGPEFELSDNDDLAFEQLLDGGAMEERLADMTPVGWYQSTSRRDLSLSDHTQELFHRFFPEPWQIAMLVQRSKHDPLSIGFFVRDSHGHTKLHSPIREFANDLAGK